jgi:hypothetical protein
MAAKKNRKVFMPIPEGDLIDVEGGARLIFVKRKTIDNWLSLGRLKRYKAGRRTLVRKSEILALVREA